jgi:hypothetical protein
MRAESTDDVYALRQLELLDMGEAQMRAESTDGVYALRQLELLDIQREQFFSAAASNPNPGTAEPGSTPQPRRPQGPQLRAGKPMHRSLRAGKYDSEHGQTGMDSVFSVFPEPLRRLDERREQDPYRKHEAEQQPCRSPIEKRRDVVVALRQHRWHRSLVAYGAPARPKQGRTRHNGRTAEAGQDEVQRRGALPSYPACGRRAGRDKTQLDWSLPGAQIRAQIDEFFSTGQVRPMFSSLRRGTVWQDGDPERR